jgi:hypothetical protein
MKITLLSSLFSSDLIQNSPIRFTQMRDFSEIYFIGNDLNVSYYFVQFLIFFCRFFIF